VRLRAIGIFPIRVMLASTHTKAHPDDIDAYMDGKDSYIRAQERKAMAWRSALRPK
jgi:hypothetical protein